MEVRADLTRAEILFGRAFIGPDQLAAIAPRLGVCPPCADRADVPYIPWSYDRLARLASTHLLLLGSSLSADGRQWTLSRLREFFGTDPVVREPCFYNQDWYLREAFASCAGLEDRWYLLRRDVADDTRGIDPDRIAAGFTAGEKFPSALLASYAFFANYLHTGGEALWKRHFVWCSDTDHNGDRIYVGRYEDPDGVNRNGFNIHRHLRLRSAYGAATEVTDRE